MARHNLRTVVWFEFVRTVTRSRFWIATLVVPVALIVVSLLVTLSNSSSRTTADDLKNAHVTFAYTDASGIVDPAIAAKAGGSPAASAASGVAAVKAGHLDAFFAYPARPATQTTRISGGTTIQVSLNTGAGFLAPQTWTGALPLPILSRSGVYRNLGLHFSISIPISPTNALIINPGHNNGDSFGGSQSQRPAL